MNALNPVRRINEQIAEPVELRLKVDKADALKRAGELLELVAIAEIRAPVHNVAHAPARTLSAVRVSSGGSLAARGLLRGARTPARSATRAGTPRPTIEEILARLHPMVTKHA